MKNSAKCQIAETFMVLSVLCLIICGVLILTLFGEILQDKSNENIISLSFYPYLGFMIGCFGLSYSYESKKQYWIARESDYLIQYCSDENSKKITYIQNQKNIFKGNMQTLEDMGYAIVIKPDLWVILSYDHNEQKIKFIVPTEFYFKERHEGIRSVYYSNYRLIEKILAKNIDRQVL